MATVIARNAPAKLNLFLRILGRRPDGYHELQTVYHALDLADRVYLELQAEGEDGQEGIRLSMDSSPPAAADDPIPVQEDNLAWRAAAAFFTETGAASSPGCRIHLHKRIPSGAGLGGGSSDAAAVLLLLNEAMEAPIDAAGLRRIASDLGADVPFFLRGGTQLGEGVGDRLSHFSGAVPGFFVLVLPPIACSTEAVYKNLAAQLTKKSGPASIASLKRPGGKELAMARALRNDLERSAMALYPALRTIREQVAASGFPQIRMSGSGAAMFLAFENRSGRDAAQQRLADNEDLRAAGVRLWAANTGAPCFAEPAVFPVA